MNELVSAETFKWFLTLMTGIVAGAWFIYDAINLLRLRTADADDPLVRDKRFGYVIGMLIGFFGIVGCLLFHDVI